jgi:CDP-diacylglycerol--serine O-phosphatidyltransferase
MYVLPSLFTAGSIGGGYFAITQTIDAVTASAGDRITPSTHLDWAAIAICLAIPFDALDGRIARMTNTTSEFGKELDSLADAITFGVAPCLLAWVWGFHSLPETMSTDLRHTLLQIGSFVCFLFLLCGASRLARFNSSSNAQPRNPGRHDRKYFVGMPIPAAAGLIASTVHFCYGYPIIYWWLAVAWIALVGLLGFLMVSTWRFWSGKEINLASAQPFQLIVVLAIVVFVLIRYSSGVLFFVALAYMFSGIWARAAYSWSRRRRHHRPEAELPPRAAAPAFVNGPHDEPGHEPGYEPSHDSYDDPRHEPGREPYLGEYQSYTHAPYEAAPRQTESYESGSYDPGMRHDDERI